MTATIEKATGATKRDVLNLCREQGVAFLRLQFTDILGINKNFEVPESQFDKALSGDIRFDGSAIEGFVRISPERDRKSTRLNSRSHLNLVCRLLLEKKKKRTRTHITHQTLSTLLIVS